MSVGGHNNLETEPLQPVYLTHGNAHGYTIMNSNTDSRNGFGTLEPQILYYHNRPDPSTLNKQNMEPVIQHQSYNPIRVLTDSSWQVNQQPRVIHYQNAIPTYTSMNQTNQTGRHSITTSHSLPTSSAITNPILIATPNFLPASSTPIPLSSKRVRNDMSGNSGSHVQTDMNQKHNSQVIYANNALPKRKCRIEGREAEPDDEHMPIEPEAIPPGGISSINIRKRYWPGGKCSGTTAINSSTAIRIITVPVRTVLIDLRRWGTRHEGGG